MKFGKIFIGLSVVLLAVALIQADDPIKPYRCVELDGTEPCGENVDVGCVCTNCWSSYCEIEDRFKTACECIQDTGVLCSTIAKYKEALFGHDAHRVTDPLCCVEYFCMPITAPPGQNPDLCYWKCGATSFSNSCTALIGASLPKTIWRRDFPLSACQLYEP